MPLFKESRFTPDKTRKKKRVSDGLWTKCEDCGEIIYKKRLAENQMVCPKCGYHFKLSATKRLALILDAGSFEEFDSDLRPADPLRFKDSRKYTERIAAAQRQTGLTEAVITGQGKIKDIPVVITVLDFDFMGGSMASVVGERVARAIDRAIERRLPLITLASSGGARMQEGMLSLMQMAKTSAALAKLSDAGLLHISIVTNPTTGGVSASFASLGDIIIAEPKALVGFAGPRVIEQTIGQKLPPGFQSAEFLLEHGLIDLIVKRKDLRERLSQLLRYLAGS